MRNNIAPDWVKDAIFYQIFPDRFAKGLDSYKPSGLQPWGSPPDYHSFQGGDLFGITEKLDYLEELGINAIYLNPIFQSPANHRYHTHDYFEIDPLLGGNGAFEKLLKESHSRGIRIILDGVFNHAGRGFFQFNHILECGSESPYVDWFHIKGFPLNAYSDGSQHTYKSWHGNKRLPQFNVKNPDVRRFLLNVAKYWTERGIDGWRLDAFKEIDDHSFWREFRDVVKGSNQDAYIVGEIWVDEKKRTAKKWLMGDQLDAIMNYGFATACISFFIGDKLDKGIMKKQGHRPKKTIRAGDFAKRIETMFLNYHKDVLFSQYNLIESHDTVRYLTLAREDKRILFLTTLFQMTYPGAPAIYYGTEIGLSGKRDPDCRRAMPWDESAWDISLLSFFRNLISIRKAHPSLRRGNYINLSSDSGKNVYAFMRSLGEEKIVVIINNNEGEYSVDVPTGNRFPDNTKLSCLLYGNSYIVRNSSIQGPSLGPLSGAILMVQ